MASLISFEVNNSIVDVTEEKNKFENYTHPSDEEFPYAQLKYNEAEIFGLSDISSEDLQQEILGPDVFQTYRKLAIEKSQTGGFYIIIIGYAQSPFRDFESCLGFLVSLDEDDNQLILNKHNSILATYGISPGVHSIKNISEVLSRGFQNEIEIRGRIGPKVKYDESDSIIIECDNITIRIICL